MKFTDDYNAKIRLWAANPSVIPMLPGPKLPIFPPQKFHSHEEMNKWKALLLRKMAQLSSEHE
jgi:hypothetical protein